MFFEKEGYISKFLYFLKRILLLGSTTNNNFEFQKVSKITRKSNESRRIYMPVNIIDNCMAVTQKKLIL